MPVLLLFRPVNNVLGQIIGYASEGKYNTVNNSSSDLSKMPEFGDYPNIATSHKHWLPRHTRGYMKLGHAA